MHILGNASHSATGNQWFISIAALIAGILLVSKKEKALKGIGTAVYALAVLVFAYSYFIPHYLGMLEQPQLLRGVSAILLTIIAYVAVYKLASGAIYLLLVAVVGPATYQFLSLVWQLEPAADWDQAKLFMSLFSAVVLSVFLAQHMKATANVAAVLLGSLLMAASVQFFVSGQSYLGGIETCLGSPREGWDASECSPFYVSWVAIVGMTILTAGAQRLSTSPLANYWTTPQPQHVVTRQYVPTSAPYQAMPEEGRYEESSWSKLKRKSASAWETLIGSKEGERRVPPTHPGSRKVKKVDSSVQAAHEPYERVP